MVKLIAIFTSFFYHTLQQKVFTKNICVTWYHIAYTCLIAPNIYKFNLYMLPKIFVCYIIKYMSNIMLYMHGNALGKLYHLTMHDTCVHVRLQ